MCNRKCIWVFVYNRIKHIYTRTVTECFKFLIKSHFKKEASPYIKVLYRQLSAKEHNHYLKELLNSIYIYMLSHQESSVLCTIYRQTEMASSKCLEV